MDRATSYAEIEKDLEPYFVVDAESSRVLRRVEDLWEYRELIYFLVWRAVKIRYKQTALGVLWVILQPLLMTLLFSIIFGSFAGISSDGIPYPIFTFAALLPWQIFSYALSVSSNSLVSDQQLITKIYFPRILVPLATILVSVLDFLIALTILIGMMVYYQIEVTPTIALLPVVSLFAILVATAVGLWLSALNVQYRDVQYIVPFLTQLWFFATPIAYPSSLIPDAWQPLYGLNPMVSVVDGFRWVLLQEAQPSHASFLISLVVGGILFVSGVVYFYSVEQKFADII